VEQGIKEFLKRIVNAMFVALLWMLICATAGIKFNLAFPEGRVKMGNVLFYIWFAASFAWLVWYIVKLWRKPVEIDE